MLEKGKTFVKRNEDEDDIDKIVDVAADRIDSKQGSGNRSKLRISNKNPPYS